MATLTCNCGYKAEDSDHYMVEGMMWGHAIEKHPEMMKNDAKGIATWLRNADKEMGVTQ